MGDRVTMRRRIVAQQKEHSQESRTTLPQHRDSSVRARTNGLFLFQMLGEELGGAIPRELVALGIIVSPCFVAEGMAGVIPIRFKRNFAFFQLSFQGARCVGTKGSVLLR